MAPPREEPTIAINSVVRAARDQVSSDLAGEVILLSLQTAQYYGAQGVAARIWALVQQPIPVAGIRDAIMSEYEVGPGDCERDVLDFLRQLAGEGLLEVVHEHPGD